MGLELAIGAVVWLVGQIVFEIVWMNEVLAGPRARAHEDGAEDEQ